VDENLLIDIEIHRLTKHSFSLFSKRKTNIKILLDVFREYWYSIEMQISNRTMVDVPGFSKA